MQAESQHFQIVTRLRLRQLVHSSHELLAVLVKQREQLRDARHHDDGVADAHVLAGAQALLECLRALWSAEGHGVKGERTHRLEYGVPLAVHLAERLKRAEVRLRDGLAAVAGAPSHLEARQMLADGLFVVQSLVGVPGREIAENLLEETRCKWL